MKKILIVEDEIPLAQGIKLYLESEGFYIQMAHNGYQALDLFEKHSFDLLLIDLMMPHMNGFELISQIRLTHPKLPLIVVSAKQEVSDKVRALKLGACDFITKPFDLEELLARIQVQFRHLSLKEENIPLWKFEHFHFKRGNLFLYNYHTHEEIPLSYRESKILELLMETNGFLSRESIIQQVWGPHYSGTERTIDNFILSLRKKIGKNAIETVRNQGYRFCLKIEKIIILLFFIISSSLYAQEGIGLIPQESFQDCSLEATPFDLFNFDHKIPRNPNGSFIYHGRWFLSYLEKSKKFSFSLCSFPQDAFFHIFETSQESFHFGVTPLPLFLKAIFPHKNKAFLEYVVSSQHHEKEIMYQSEYSLKEIFKKEIPYEKKLKLKISSLFPFAWFEKRTFDHVIWEWISCGVELQKKEDSFILKVKRDPLKFSPCAQIGLQKGDEILAFSSPKPLSFLKNKNFFEQITLLDTLFMWQNDFDLYVKKKDIIHKIEIEPNHNEIQEKYSWTLTYFLSFLDILDKEKWSIQKIYLKNILFEYFKEWYKNLKDEEKKEIKEILLFKKEKSILQISLLFNDYNKKTLSIEGVGILKENEKVKVSCIKDFNPIKNSWDFSFSLKNKNEFLFSFEDLLQTDFTPIACTLSFEKSHENFLYYKNMTYFLEDTCSQEIQESFASFWKCYTSLNK